MAIQTLNPATGEIVKTFDPHDDAYISSALDKSEHAFKHHRLTSFEDRADKMRRVADILEANKQNYGRIITLEMGKTHAAAVAEVEKCALNARYYADHAHEHLQRQQIKTEKKDSFVDYLPIGPVLAVMPWNFPFWQVFRFATPAVMAGNTALLKHASNVPQCALLMEEIFQEAGFDKGCFQTLLIGSDKVESIIGDSRVRAVTLTGSEGAGSKVASIAGKHIKKTVLELGGSDAFIIMPSADLEDAVAQGVKGRTQNAGQSCIAAKRFIVHADIYDEVRARFVDKLSTLKVGNPMDKETDMGPLATKQGVEDLDKQVKETIEKGAQRVCGAEPIKEKGFFYKPGLLDNIPADSPAYSEEFFGPVALFFKAGSLDEAIYLANATRFGLGSAIFTQDEKEMTQAVRDLDAGTTAINTIVASDPRLPFGGVKSSGYGRELSADGIREFTNIKTVVRA